MSAQIILMLTVLGAAVSAVYGLPRILARRAEQLKIQGHLIEKFFNAAEKLTEADDAPEWMMEQLDALAVFLMKASVARRLIFDVFSGRFRRLIQEEEAEIRKRQMEIEALSPAVRGLFLQAIACGALATTFNSAVFGAAVRRSIFAAVKEADRSQIYQHDVPDRQLLGAVSDLTRHSRAAA